MAIKGQKVGGGPVSGNPHPFPKTAEFLLPLGFGVHKMSHASKVSFAKKMQTPFSNNTREDSTHGHHQMVNTKIRLIIFVVAKDGEALYSEQKQDGS